MNCLYTTVCVIVLAFAASSSATALTMKECSAKYRAAKQAGLLNGRGWNEFRKVECGAPPDVPPTTAQNPFAPDAAMPASPPAANEEITADKGVLPSTLSRPSANNGSVVFPSSISPDYSNLSAGQARRKTCLDQYKANKNAVGSGNGGLFWIQSDGGYYSECNKRLK